MLNFYTLYPRCMIIRKTFNFKADNCIVNKFKHNYNLYLQTWKIQQPMSIKVKPISGVKTQIFISGFVFL